jgi:hypothetical protein
MLQRLGASAVTVSVNACGRCGNHRDPLRGSQVLAYFRPCYRLRPKAPSICSVCFWTCSCMFSNRVLDCST